MSVELNNHFRFFDIERDCHDVSVFTSNRRVRGLVQVCDKSRHLKAPQPSKPKSLVKIILLSVLHVFLVDARGGEPS